MPNTLFNPFLTSPAGQLAQALDNLDAQTALQVTRLVQQSEQALNQIVAAVTRIGLATFNTALEANQAGSAAAFAAQFAAAVARVQAQDASFALALPTA